jgi:hypothetical protein
VSQLRRRLAPRRRAGEPPATKRHGAVAPAPRNEITCPTKEKLIMSGHRVYETLQASDVRALNDVGAHVGLVGDASHTHGAADFKAFHLELNLYISDDQILMLRTRYNTTYIKLKPGLMLGGGKVDLEVYYYEQDVVELLDGRSQYALRTGKASFGHGATPGMIGLDFK